MPPCYRCALSLVAFAYAAIAVPALADVDPRDGIDWVTIGATNNPAYAGPDPNNTVTGRGGVSYEYRIGKYEATSAQWGEFLNAAFNRPDPLPWVERPLQVGGGMQPVGGATWRTCAMFCNWLHNNKATNREAFLNGAYDTSTFGVIALPNGGFHFSDQFTHHADARYWIPTLDEWLKAAYYDPNRFGPGQGGWWQYNITSDSAPVYGAPEGYPNGSAANQANSGFSILPGRGEFFIPLGAYEDVMSPWGLFDTAGGTREWLEEVTTGPFTQARLAGGSGWAAGVGGDRIGSGFGGGAPSEAPYTTGLRFASAIPTSGTLAILGAYGILSARRRRAGGITCAIERS